MELFELRLQGTLDNLDEFVRQLGARDHRDKVYVQLHTVEVTYQQPLHFGTAKDRWDLATSRFHAPKIRLRLLRQDAGIYAALVQPYDRVLISHRADLR